MKTKKIAVITGIIILIFAMLLIILFKSNSNTHNGVNIGNSNDGNSSYSKVDGYNSEALSSVHFSGYDSDNPTINNGKFEPQYIIVDTSGKDKDGKTYRANDIIEFYNQMIDNNQFKLSKQFDSTLAYAIYYGDNPSFIIRKILPELRSCSEYKNIVDAIVADTQRQPLKQYFYMMNSNDIQKIDVLVQQCLPKK